ncbi:VOC family protein [Antarcticibacterium arcticum]|uniref:VOC family protein n=1 Tax=Antarcticibacterium arcticum TaxID=2585771 RepID=A0A5B8YGG0_9FLAO|nr:VOC family protein [Antarcticibacterium arcticum]QED36960.1 VOC family protein [Antarcticibacterium arcticum]
MDNTAQKILPFLWFDTNAKEAVDFYTTVFKNAKINSITRFPGAGKEIHKQETDSIMTVDFSIENYRMVALNGGPDFKFNSSISFFLLYEDEKKLEEVWGRLLEGGSEMMPLDTYDWSPKYGWLQDRFGVNWQVMLEKERSSPETVVPMIFFTGKNQGKAAEAIAFYTSVFHNSYIQGMLTYGKENPFANGHIMHAQFSLEDQTFMAMDSGMENDFPFSEAISFMVNCKDQKEIDYYWNELTAGGDPAAQQCGWLKDKFGVSWQVAPAGMNEILNDPDKDKANRIMDAVLQIRKFDLEKLNKAAGKS